MSAPLRLCLIMHSTKSYNLGVGALTVAQVEILRELAAGLGRKPEITILDWKDARAPYISGDDLRILDIDRKFLLSPAGYWREMRRADIMIDIGAGDSFADIYGAKRLTMQFAMKILAWLAGTPQVMAPQTVGPFTQPRSRKLARFVMNRTAVLATRDKLSTAAAQELGTTTPVIEASDVALRLPYDPPAPRAGGSLKVGINVSGLLMQGGYTGKNEFGIKSDYPGLIEALIAHFQAHPAGCEVHLVSHVIFPEGASGEDDYTASRALAQKFPGTVLAPRFSTPSEAKTYIAGLDFFMGARMHACIAAFSSGVPVVPMAYSRKFEGLFGSIGYTRTVDCTAETREAIFAKIAAAFEDRAALMEEQRIALAKGREKLALYTAALGQLMARVP
ncbi:MAG: polysaccharide pyruvyl transferase family protein [Roseivivax sp.]|nr:polysaccharide pyruvyl transferase family protein [Roseivivax sp.]